MTTCSSSSAINQFLTTPAELFNLTTQEETLTGQPIEELSFVKNILVYFTPNLTDEHQMFPAGQIPVGRFKLLSKVQITTNQVLKIDGEHYRVIASNETKVKRKTYFFTVHMELFQHNPIN